MKYCIITETQEIFKVERILAGIKVSTIFADIEEDIKYEQLEYAALLRFKDCFITAQNLVFNLNDKQQYLKLIPQSDNNIKLDIPSLSLMA